MLGLVIALILSTVLLAMGKNGNVIFKKATGFLFKWYVVIASSRANYYRSCRFRIPYCGISCRRPARRLNRHFCWRSCCTDRYRIYWSCLCASNLRIKNSARLIDRRFHRHGSLGYAKGRFRNYYALFGCCRPAVSLLGSNKKTVHDICQDGYFFTLIYRSKFVPQPDASDQSSPYKRSHARESSQIS